MGGKARICGGHREGFGTVTDCHEYAFGDDHWTRSNYSLSEARNWHVSWFISNDIAIHFFTKKMSINVQGEHSLGQWILAPHWGRHDFCYH